MYINLINIKLYRSVSNRIVVTVLCNRSLILLIIVCKTNLSYPLKFKFNKLKLTHFIHLTDFRFNVGQATLH